MRVEIIKIRINYPGIDPNQLQSKLASALTNIENQGCELVAITYMEKCEFSSGEQMYSYTAVFRDLEVSQNIVGTDADTEVVVDGEGESKEVKWVRSEDCSAKVSLAELIAAAEREFPGLAFEDLLIDGYMDSDQYNINGESSYVRMGYLSLR